MAGPGCGALVGGYVWSVRGPVAMFRAFAAVAAVLCARRAVMGLCCCWRARDDADGGAGRRPFWKRLDEELHVMPADQRIELDDVVEER